MLFVFFLGFLTSAHENKCLQAFNFSFFVCLCEQEFWKSICKSQVMHM